MARNVETPCIMLHKGDYSELMFTLATTGYKHAFWDLEPLLLFVWITCMRVWEGCGKPPAFEYDVRQP